MTQCVYLICYKHVNWARISVLWVLFILTVFAVATPDGVEMLLNGLLINGEIWKHQVIKRGTAFCVFGHVIMFV